MDEFRRQVETVFPGGSGEDRQLWETARLYVRECEAFDRTCCTGTGPDGEAMPHTTWQYYQIQKNAALVFEACVSRLEGIEDVRAKLRSAICGVLRRQSKGDGR